MSNVIRPRITRKTLWGTYGKGGFEHCAGMCPEHQLHYKPLEECDSDHLQMILRNQRQVAECAPLKKVTKSCSSAVTWLRRLTRLRSVGWLRRRLMGSSHADWSAKPMGDNQCKLCATPDVEIKNGHQTCAGCGTVCLQDLTLYLKRAHTRITFYRATRKYEKRFGYGCHARVPFGQFLLDSNFELIAKP
jgi:hypothetical protein